nr:ferric reductase-like transmembrane domain-containing protein [Roseibium sp. RKSG952]
MRLAAIAIWTVLAVVMAGPVGLAATSPYLAYRDVFYITGGFAGIVVLSLLVVQPLLAGRLLPGVRSSIARRWHRRIGAIVVFGVLLHVGGLYIASPQDTLDALLLVSPTPFSIYGVAALLAVIVTAVLAIMRQKLGLRYTIWRLLHNALAIVIVVATVIHAVQIEGAMEDNV